MFRSFGAQGMIMWVHQALSAAVRPRSFRPSACDQWLAQALGPLSENSHFQAFLGLRITVTVVVVFLVPPAQQPYSPLPEVRKHYPEQTPVDLPTW